MRILWGVIIILIFVACGGSKVLVSNKDNAETAASQGNFSQAVDAWKLYFDQTAIEEVAGANFADAAKTAFKAGNIKLALSWFDQARYKNYADAGMYITLAKIFNEKKNISKELTALEYIIENYRESSAQINSRLFDVYSEIELFENALQVWANLDETTKNELSKLDIYFHVQRELKDSTVCDSVSLVLLEKDPQNVEALEWNAKKYYWKGENRYQSEMAIYNKKKTNRQYKILLNELDKATADFKRSLKYFDKLWEIEPGEKYASYFANIYARFGDEKKSKLYQKYMK
ncbi:MAG: hypothetical protein KAH68_01435 [Draconibacterium sp.]|nr:hypothetical protein [Draconibacterium sp.]